MAKAFGGSLHKALLFASAALFVLALGYSVFFHLTVPPAPYDDAYITYRYVENLYAGHGLVYNRGERVFGSTTPLYVVWLIVIRGLAPNAHLPELAVRTNAVWHIASAVVAAALIARLHGRRIPALLFGALYALHPEMLYISASGMESFLFLTLVFASILALTHNRMTLAGALAGLSLVTRPEGAFVLAVWGLRWLALARGVGWRGLNRRALAAALAAPALWTVLATAYYGSPVPHSIIAKLQPVYLIPPGWAGRTIVERIRAWTAPALIEALPSLVFNRVTALLLLGGALGLTVSSRGRSVMGWALAFFYAMLLAFYVLSNPFMFPWYWPLFWSLAFLAVAAGLPMWGERLVADQRVGLRILGAIPWVLALALLAYQPLVENRFLAQSLAGEPITYVEYNRARMVVYREAAEWLNARTTPETTVATPEIGALGFYFHGHIYDACGLVSPQAIPFLPAPASERASGWDGVIGTAFARYVQADYVVSMTTFSDHSIDVDPWFLRHYQLVKRLPLPHEIWRARSVLIYQRRGPATGGGG